MQDMCIVYKWYCIQHIFENILQIILSVQYLLFRKLFSGVIKRQDTNDMIQYRILTTMIETRELKQHIK